MNIEKSKMLRRLNRSYSQAVSRNSLLDAEMPLINTMILGGLVQSFVCLKKGRCFILTNKGIEKLENGVD